MKRIFFLLLFILTACGTPTPTPLPTPLPTNTPSGLSKRLAAAAENQVGVAETAQAEQILLEHLQAKASATQAVIAKTEQAAADGTQNAKDARAAAQTQAIVNVTIVAGKAKDELTARAGDAQATSTANAANVRNTAEVQSTQTAQYFGAIYATSTVVMANARNTQEAEKFAIDMQIKHDQARAVELAVMRQELINTTQAVLPWAALGVLTIAAIYLAIQYNRTRVFKQDERGDAPIVMHDGKMVDPDLLPPGILDFGKMLFRRITDPESERQIKDKDQAVNLLTRGVPHQPKPDNRLPVMSTSTRSTVNLVPYESLSQTIGQAERQFRAEDL